MTKFVNCAGRLINVDQIKSFKFTWERGTNLHVTLLDGETLILHKGDSGYEELPKLTETSIVVPAPPGYSAVFMNDQGIFCDQCRSSRFTLAFGTMSRRVRLTSRRLLRRSTCSSVSLRSWPRTNRSISLIGDLRMDRSCESFGCSDGNDRKRKRQQPR
jgi:hypothetical protein